MRPSIQRYGKTFVLLDDVHAFQEKSGRRFEIRGLDMAVFKVDDQFFAIGNVCPHQGASLCDGTVVDGNVICPLHAWTFLLENGKGPEAFGTCVPSYETRIENGRVYVCPNTTRACP